MKVKDVMEYYNKKVPFPICPKDIEAAGYEVTTYLKNLAADLEKCDDLEIDERAKMVCSMVSGLIRLQGG